MSGITPEGFEPKDLEDIKTDLESGFRSVFGAAITVIAQSVFGQLIGIFADRLADLWQLGLSLYNGSTREGAVGVQLDNLGALTGTTRKQATSSEVTLTLTGTPSTAIPAGQLVSIPDVGTQFTNDDPATIGGGGTVSALFRAVEVGPKTAPAGTVTQIDTPVAGWASVTNPADASVVGTDIETDTAFRLRQVQELRALGSSTVAAIRTKVGQVTNVSDCFVFENVGDATDANGLPPHSFETVVAGGDSTVVAQTIEDNKPVGIASYGTSTVSVVDGNGFAVDIKFSRPAALNAYVVLDVIVNPAEFPADGVALIKAAIVALQPNYRTGYELRASALTPSYLPRVDAPLTTGVRGVLETLMPKIGTAPTPGTSTTVIVSNRQKIALDTSRITVNVTYQLPS